MFITNLPNCLEFHRRKRKKNALSFCAHVDIINYWKTLTFFIARAKITWAYILSARAIVNYTVIQSHLNLSMKGDLERDYADALRC